MNLSTIKNTNDTSCLRKELEKAKNDKRQMALHIEKLNGVVKTLTEQREVDRLALKESVKNDIQECIHPFIQKITVCQKCNRDNPFSYQALCEELSRLLDDSGTTAMGRDIDLSPNEEKIIHLICQGNRTKEISDQLRLAPSSVSWYRRQIRNKLGITNSKTNLRTYLIKKFRTHTAHQTTSP